MKTRSIIFLVTSIVVSGLWQGCSSREDMEIPEEPQMTGIAAPLLLAPDSTVIELSDYFRNPKAIDSVFVNENLDYHLSADSMQMIITVRERNLPKLSVLTAWADGYPYTLLLQKSPRIWIHISVDIKGKKPKNVQIAGEMNDWNPKKTWLKLKDDAWQTDLLLFPGKYQYQVVADGKWMLDPNNPEKADNNIGGYNSVLWAGSIDNPGKPQLFTRSAEDNKITIGMKNKVKELFVLWENYLLPEKFMKVDSAGIHITLPPRTRQFDRSFVRVCAINNYGISNQILVPLHNGFVIKDPADLGRTDKEAMIIYFMMIDRFKDGDPKNNAPVMDKEVDRRANFQGGDLPGITEKIEDNYFSNLGVNTLWISPLTQNPPDAWAEYPPPHRKFSGYHGYWPITLTTVDPRFGTSAELKKLVTEAHDKKINVILDYVSNHVHQESPLIKQHPDWATPLILKDKRKNIRLWDEQRLTTWFDNFLPTLDLSRQEVIETMSDSSLFWIREYNLDGFRHDATKHIPEIYWRTLTKKLKEKVIIPENRNLYQIGETFGSRDLIRSYINPGMLDGQFDFNLYFDARTVFARDYASFRDLNYSLHQTFNYYGEHSLMGNITGNQDLARFISFASGAISFAEDDKKAGWERDIQVKDTTGYRKLASLMAFNMTIPGIPVIFYGDEFGMSGGGDPDNRRMMRFDSLNKHEQYLKSVTTKLSYLRKNNLPLIYGDFTGLKVTDNVYVYMRSYFDEAVIVVFNKDRSKKKIVFELPGRYSFLKLVPAFGNGIMIEKNTVTITLEGNSFEILTK